MGHPWKDFLDARARAIDWLYYRNPDMETHHNDAAIARTLSMDPMQVTLIRMRDEKPGDNKGQLRAVSEHETHHRHHEAIAEGRRSQLAHRR